jgi:uncharacterized membrane protein
MSADAGTDWRRRLRRGIAWTIALKLVALILLWAFFFSPAHRAEMTAERVESQIVDPAREAPADD